jgi:hypothetical protein
MNPDGARNQNDCVGEGQEQFNALRPGLDTRLGLPKRLKSKPENFPTSYPSIKRGSGGYYRMRINSTFVIKSYDLHCTSEFE